MNTACGVSVLFVRYEMVCMRECVREVVYEKVT